LGSVTLFFGIKVCVFCRFSRKRQNESSPIFFQGLGENTLFIPTCCIEMQRIRPLNGNQPTSRIRCSVV